MNNRGATRAGVITTIVYSRERVWSPEQHQKRLRGVWEEISGGTMEMFSEGLTKGRQRQAAHRECQGLR